MRRKSWLLAAVLAGLFVAQLALAGANSLWAQYLPGPKLTIINKSGYPASEIYLVFLTLAHSDDNYHRLLWQHDEFLPTFPVISTVDNTVTVTGANNNPYADYSTTLARLPVDADGNHYFFVPRAENDSVPPDKQGIYSGRLWLSFKKPYYTHVYSATSYEQPDYGNVHDVNYNTIVDFYEVAIDATTFKVTGDTTNVDNVAMPLMHDLKNNGVRLPGSPMGLDLTLGKLRQAIQADPKFKGLVTPQRIYAPGHGIQKGLLDPTYYTNYVNKCWKLWEDNTLSFKVDNITWSGTVNAVTKKLKLTGTVSGLPEPEDHYIDWPPSKDIFLCNGVFDGVPAPTPEHPTPTPAFLRDKDIKNRVASALNRTVMHLPPYADPAHPTTEPWSYPESYYQGVFCDPADYQTNVYAKILHELAIDGSCYAYAYDDNDGKSTTISGQATDIFLTINSCRATTVSTVDLLLGN